MSLVHPQLAAFAAVIEATSFEGAAQRLHVTPSAISQRVKALEDRLGQVLVVRQLPCRPTEAGQSLLRKVWPMLALESEALEAFQLELSANAAARPLKIAVNDDSLETWLLPALAELHQQFGYLFDVMVDDQDHSLHRLREGSVLGAVTADHRPIQGCAVKPLGTMRYQAIASPELAQRYFANGVNADSLRQAPMLVFNRKDELQHRFIAQITGQTPCHPPTHYLPTSKGFVDAAALSIGWCMVPECMITEALAHKRVCLLAPEQPIEVPLYWQHASVRSQTLAHLTEALRRHAEQMLGVT
ncbi:LysR family transcriptional regulator ArgP [Marinomonas ostreistagni]|uniref:LysR family transcriptional regulator ArgP n=1 Tax=Marinomonas ostreistagni TaxID=359209 RepID=UPI0019524645|nr:LysR family transcriptional regulator ArgP [Marinomonas ostreistagni]MBM6550747.1 LysR family transcriptional regulator ArgP [Marinomonas ostreistagni]